MTEDQIKIFLAVAETGSFSGAEETMHISKQAMFKQVNHLEEELGVRLMIRSRNGIALTEAGEIFRRGMLKMNREFSNLVSACRKADGSYNTLRVGNVEHQALLLPVTQAFAARYPHVQIKQVIHPNHSGEWRVANGVQDVAETFHLGFVHGNGAFAYRPLTKVPYVAAMRRGHPLSRRRKAALTELAPYETMCFPIMLEEEYANRIREAFRHSPGHLICREDVDHQVEAAYECVSSERILITANPFIEGIGDLVKVPLAEGWMREYGVIYREPASGIVRDYIETAIEVYRQM